MTARENTAVNRLPTRPDLPGPVPQETDLLDLLRREAARARSAPHMEFFRACSLLTLDRNRAPRLFARALYRVLGQALGNRPVFLRAGSVEQSFDEAWILRLSERLAADDLNSAEFLLRSRVPQPYRRSVAFLVNGLR